MKKYDKVIFVSTDNTCRSPLAESVMEELTKDKEIEVLSRGLIVLFPEPINPKTVETAKRYGISLHHPMSIPFSEKDLGEKNLVLTMTEQQKKSIYEEYEDAINVYTINEFIGGDGDMEGLYGKELSAYIECFEKISTLVNLITAKLFTGETAGEREQKGKSGERK